MVEAQTTDGGGGKAESTKLHWVTGGGGAKLAVHEAGNPNGTPLVFLHGYMNCYLQFSCQIDSSLASEHRLLLLDMRGHGLSEKSESLESYTDQKLWADDVRAVVEHFQLQKSIFVPFSYGALAALLYLQHHGTKGIGGLFFCSPAFKLVESFELLGPGLLEGFDDILSPDLARNIRGLRKSAREGFKKPVDPEHIETMVAYNMLVPLSVREYLVGLRAEFDELIPKIALPTALVMGGADTFLAPETISYFRDRQPGAQISIYDGVGHYPCIEDAERFNKELAAFARKVTRD